MIVNNKLQIKLDKLAIVFLFISWVTNVYSQDEEVYLSHTDKGYQYIEYCQATLCEKRPIFNCSATSKKCRDSISNLLNMISEKPPSNSLIRCMCLRVSTRYEVPGIYRMLTGYYDEIEGAAKKLNFSIAIRPKLGTLAIKEVNASSEESGYSVIFINSTFMTFANEIMKVASRTVNTDNLNSDKSYDEDDRIRDLNYALATQPKLIYDFLVTIVRYVEGNPNIRLGFSPYDNYTIVTAYLRGVELFALAHEYGHILMGHTKNSSKSLVADDGTLITGPKKAVVDESPNAWADELVADFIAMKILGQIHRDNRDKKNDTMGLSVLCAPEFYFNSLRLLSAARVIMNGDKANIPEQWEIKSLAKSRKYSPLHRHKTYRQRSIIYPPLNLNPNRQPN